LAIVGQAEIIVRAITTKVESDIRSGFNGAEKAGAEAGRSIGTSLNKELSKSSSGSTVFKDFGDKIGVLEPKALKAAQGFHTLVRTGYTVQSALGALVGSLGAVGGGLGALIGVAGGAGASIAVLGNIFVAFGSGMAAAKLALSGVGAALGKLNSGGKTAQQRISEQKRIRDAERELALTMQRNAESIVKANNAVRDAQINLNKAYKAGREEIQQLGFDAEDAALSEQKAALALQDARTALAQVQDLPPNSRARKEAELAYREADLNYRRAKDKSADLSKEQDRLAKVGVAGTDTVISATKALSEAEQEKSRTVRDGIEAEIKAQEALAEARRQAATASGQDPFKNLTKSQIEFVKHLYAMKPLFKDLQESVAHAFLTPLTDAIDLLATKAFPVLKTGLTEVGGAMGGAAKAIAQALTSSENLGKLGSIFTSSAGLLSTFGRTAAVMLGNSLTLLQAVAPLAQRFATFLEKQSNAFKSFLDTKSASGELQKFFTTAGDLMARLGHAFGNIFGGLGHMIQANIGPGSGGDIMLQWIEKATAGFKNIPVGFMANYFQAASKNLTEILDTLNIVIHAIMAAGASPAIGQFWQILESGAATFRNVVMESVKTAPVLAILVNRLMEMLAVFADSGSIIAFFNALGFVAAGVESVVKAIGPLLNVLGPVFATISAFGLVFKLASSAVLIFKGIIGQVLKPLVALEAWAIKNTAASAKETAATASLAASKQALAMATLRLNVAKAQEAVASTEVALADAEQYAAEAFMTGTKAELVAATEALAVAQGENAVAVGGLAVANDALTVSEAAAEVGAIGMGAAIWGALAPLLPIILPLAAIIGGIFAVISINQQNLDKAVTATTEDLKNGTSATKAWGDALLSIPDSPIKDSLKDVEGVHKALGEVKTRTGEWAQETTNAGKKTGNVYAAGRAGLAHYHTALSELHKAWGAYGDSLANVAATDLPTAENGFKKLMISQELSTAQQIDALDNMPKYKTALEEQATALGVVITNQDGSINKEKELAFARGDGAVAVMRQVDSLVALAQGSGAATAQLSKVGEVVDGHTTTVADFQASLKAKNKAFMEEMANDATLAAMGVSTETIKVLEQGGLTSAEIIKQVKAGNSSLLEEAQKSATQMSANYGPALASIAADGVTTPLEAAAQAALDKGQITIDQFLNTTGNKIAGYTPPVIDIKPGTKEFDKLPKTVQDAIKSANTTVKVGVQSAEKKGHIKIGVFDVPFEFSGFKNGGFIKALANGGFISGAGGPRDDRVPAMLSAGEYVMNSAATQRYLPLLNQLNNGSATFTSNTPAQAPTINISVHPSPGMSETELASAVSRELAFQMRKGSV